MAASSRNEFDDFFDDDDDKPVADTRADGRLYRVPLGRLSPNLVNPRTEFGSEDELIDFGKSLARRQNQPCPVVSRSAYLKLWPDHADKVGTVDYVLVSGERRYRAATVVGLAGLNCVVDDGFAVDRRTFMEAVVSENVDRQNFDPIEEAYAVKSLVREFGSNRAVAQHFERVDGWVTQRILLTHLAPDVQWLVRAKEMPLEAARKLGKLARDGQWTSGQQATWWQEERDRKAGLAQERAQAKKQTSPTPSPPPVTPPVPPPAPVERAAPAEEPEQKESQVPGPSFTAGKLDSPPQGPTPDAQAAEPPVQTSAPPEQHHVPEQRIEPSATPIPAGRPLPYDDGVTIGRHLALKMDAEAFLNAAQVMVVQCWDKGDADLSFSLLSTMLDTAVHRDGDRLRPLLKEFLAQLPTETSKA